MPALIDGIDCVLGEVGDRLLQFLGNALDDGIRCGQVWLNADLFVVLGSDHAQDIGDALVDLHVNRVRAVALAGVATHQRHEPLDLLDAAVRHREHLVDLVLGLLEDLGLLFGCEIRVLGCDHDLLRVLSDHEVCILDVGERVVHLVSQARRDDLEVASLLVHEV